MANGCSHSLNAATGTCTKCGDIVEEAPGIPQELEPTPVPDAAPKAKQPKKLRAAK